MSGMVQRWLNRQRGALVPAQRAPRTAAGVSVDEPPGEPTRIKGIRRRRPRDLGACARLLRVVFDEGQYPTYWPDAPRGWLTADDVVDAWVAERQGEILGHVAISRVGLDGGVSGFRWREITAREPSELVAVSRLFVRSRVRGEGIGSALLDVAVEAIRARGQVPVLDVVSTSTDAIRLYEDRGWRLLAQDAWGRKPDRLWIYSYAAPPA